MYLYNRLSHRGICWWVYWRSLDHWWLVRTHHSLLLIHYALLNEIGKKTEREWQSVTSVEVRVANWVSSVLPYEN